MTPQVSAGLSFTDLAGAAMAGYNSYMDNRPTPQTYQSKADKPVNEGEGGDEGGNEGGSTE